MRSNLRKVLPAMNIVLHLNEESGTFDFLSVVSESGRVQSLLDLTATDTLSLTHNTLRVARPYADSRVAETIVDLRGIRRLRK
jgi:hypothetical protein